MGTEVGVVFNKLSDRLWLPRLREWMRASGPALNKLEPSLPVNPFGCPDDALHWRAEKPNEHLMVTFGFTRREIESRQNFAISCGEPIIVGDPDANNNGPASATFLTRETAVTCSDVRPQLRKSIIRSELCKRVQIRPPRSDAEDIYAGQSMFVCAVK
jgi:hypothetical protein